MPLPNKQAICHNFTIASQGGDSGIDIAKVPTTDTLYDAYTLQGVKVASQIRPYNLGDKVGRGLYLLTDGSQTIKIRVK